MAKEIYEVFTLFDITYTGTKRNFNPHIIPFVDQSHQKITDVDTWQKSRNQQRNWDTTLQLLGLRAQLASYTFPVVVFDDLSKYNFDKKYIGMANIWHFTCEYEQDIFQILEDDFKNVPMITGLLDSVKIDPACFLAHPECNIYFRKMEFR